MGPREGRFGEEIYDVLERGGLLEMVKCDGIEGCHGLQGAACAHARGDVTRAACNVRTGGRPLKCELLRVQLEKSCLLLGGTWYEVQQRATKLKVRVLVGRRTERGV